MATAPRLLYLVTEDWYFWSHRLPMARAARDAGFEVTVATRVEGDGDRIRAEGFALYPLSWRRRDHSPWAALRAIAEIYRLIRRNRPDIVHAISVKPVVYGGLAALLARGPGLVSSLTGMGYALASADPGARRLRLPIMLVLRMLLWRRRSLFVVQNEAHRDALRRLAPGSPDRIQIIRGSGVDTHHFVPLPEPTARPITVAFVGRLLADKGVRTLIEAHQRLARRGVSVRLLIAGMPDAESPTSIPADEVRRWSETPGVTWLGHVEDVRRVWSEAQIAVLPSHHEGLPLSLLEAAACARPLIASDIPGCRVIAHAGVNALLVPVGDAAALAHAIETLAGDEALRRGFGAASRSLVDPALSSERIGAETVALYRRLLKAPR